MRRAGIHERRALGGSSLLPPGAPGAPSAAPTTPLTILGSAVKLWLRADLGITIGTGVSAWADQSGNANDFAQGTGGSQPAFEAAGYSGLPSVLFDGVDDVLSNTTLAATLPGGTDTPFSLYIPVQFLAATGVHSALSAGNSGVANPYLQVNYKTTGTTWNVAKRDDAGVAKASPALGVASFNRTLLELHHDGTTSAVLAINGVEQAAFDLDVGIATFNRLSLGALVRNTTTQFGNVRIPEVVLCSAVSSAGDRTAMRAYFTRYP
jgi:hypothetical protein